MKSIIAKHFMLLLLVIVLGIILGWGWGFRRAAVLPRVVVPHGFERVMVSHGPSVAADRQQLHAPGHPPVNLQAGVTFSHLEVGVEGHQVTVTGSAEVYEMRPGVFYVWSLRIYSDIRNKVLHREHHYEDQAFWLAPGETLMKPTFSDSFRLPAGIYNVELSMYAVPQDFSFRRTRRGEDLKMKTWGRVGGHKQIKIPG
jgi:hypothetical protein